jgi:hypothetical protein
MWEPEISGNMEQGKGKNITNTATNIHIHLAHIEGVNRVI